MATITRPNNFTAGTTAVAAQVNANENTIYNEFNGNIDNDNIKANAGIVDTKLAQITTSNKVSTTSITGTFNNIQAVSMTVTNISGSSFVAYADARFKVGNFTVDLSTTGDQAITGVGFTPKAVFVFQGLAGTNRGSFGFASGSGASDYDNIGLPDYTASPTAGFFSGSSSGGLIYSSVVSNSAEAHATLKTFDADGFTFTKAKTGSPTGTAYMIYMTLR